VIQPTCSEITDFKKAVSQRVKGIVRQKLTGVKNMLKQKIFIQKWGAGHFFKF
jgi:hypothetical protein